MRVVGLASCFGLNLSCSKGVEGLGVGLIYVRCGAQRPKLG